ncbi:MAG: hypothetical protein M9955_19685 [Rhizobiaceae bacterium]|nr:hypothetical protein [Rhizobiaceae bacterium]
MSRWLQAAKSASTLKDKTDKTDKTAGDTTPPALKLTREGVLSVKSVLSDAGGSISPVARPPVAPAVSAADPEPVTVQKSDAELYAEALRRIQPCGYGPVAAFLGWGMTRAANAETVLREAGRIRYDHTGRGVFVDGPIPSQPTGERS